MASGPMSAARGLAIDEQWLQTGSQAHRHNAGTGKCGGKGQTGSTAEVARAELGDRGAPTQSESARNGTLPRLSYPFHCQVVTPSSGHPSPIPVACPVVIL